MRDAATEFFTGLGERGHEPVLGKATGTVRVELVDGKETERWLIAVDRGDVTVSHKNVGADCTFRLEKALFKEMVGGRVNAAAAVLRGEVALEGNWELMVLFQRLLPGPPGSQRRQ